MIHPQPDVNSLKVGSRKERGKKCYDFKDAFSPYYSAYNSCLVDENNLFNNQDFLFVVIISRILIDLYVG